MTPKKNRLFGLMLFFIPLSLGVFFLMSALKSNREATSRKDGERVNSASPVRIAREGYRSRAGRDNIRVKESARV